MFILKKIFVFNLAMMLLIGFSGTSNSETFTTKSVDDSVSIKNQPLMLAFGRFGGGGSMEFDRSRDVDFSNRFQSSPGRSYNPPTFHNDRNINPNGGYMIPGNISNQHTQIRKDNQININNNNININNHNINNRNVIDPNRISNINYNRYPYNYPGWNYYHHHDGNYWRGFWNGYNYRYPYGVALTTALVTIPLTAIAVSAASQPNVNYYYNEGVYYTQSSNGYNVAEPPTGMTVQSLPDGMLPVNVDGTEFYYYFGTFYNKTPQGMFQVVDAPCGATVPYIPDGFNELQIDGKTVLQAFNTYYLSGQDNGNTIYTVVDPNYI